MLCHETCSPHRYRLSLSLSLQVFSVVAVWTGDQFPAATPRPRPLSPEGRHGAGAGKGRAIADTVQAGHSGCAGSSWGGRRYFLQVSQNFYLHISRQILP